MTPARFKHWFLRARKNAASSRLRAQHDGLGVKMPVAEWDAGQLEHEGEGALHDVLAELQEHCDALEESARYTLEMLDAAGAVLATTVHRCSPAQPHSPDASRAAESSSSNALVAMLVRHLENREKLLAGHTQISLGAIGTMLGNMRQMMEMQGTEMRSLREQNSSLLAHLQARADGHDEEQSEEERAESIARTRAWERVGELAPDALKLIMAHVGVDPRMGGPNGSA